MLIVVLRKQKTLCKPLTTSVHLALVLLSVESEKPSDIISCPKFFVEMFGFCSLWEHTKFGGRAKCL